MITAGDLKALVMRRPIGPLGDRPDLADTFSQPRDCRVQTSQKGEEHTSRIPYEGRPLYHSVDDPFTGEPLYFRTKES